MTSQPQHLHFVPSAVEPEPLWAAAVNVALLDRSGVIVAVNDAWTEFSRRNGGDPLRTGVGVSYLEVCAAAGDDPAAHDTATAIRTALGGDLPAPLAVRIPCHAPDRYRWFDELISSRFDDRGHCVGATVTLSPTVREPTVGPAGPVSPAGPEVDLTPDNRSALGELEWILLSAQPLAAVLEQVAELAIRAVPGAQEVSVSLTRAGRGDELAWPEPPDTGRPVSPDTDRPGHEQRHFLAVGLPTRVGPVGTLTCFSTGSTGSADPFDRQAQQIARAFAERAGTVLRNADLHAAAVHEIEQLRDAMASRAAIEQAKSIVMNRYRSSPEAAFGFLVGLASRSGRKVRDVAETVISSQIDAGPADRTEPDRADWAD